MRVLEREQSNHFNLMALYEKNFSKFISLVPWDRHDEFSLRGKDCGLVLHVQLVARERYTTTWHVSIRYVADLTALVCPQFSVRLYHDAKVLEVLHFQGHGRFQGDYPYPNPWMYARDEKRQVNGFLGELLGYCLVNQYHSSAMQKKSTHSDGDIF